MVESLHAGLIYFWTDKVYLLKVGFNDKILLNICLYACTCK